MIFDTSKWYPTYFWLTPTKLWLTPSQFWLTPTQFWLTPAQLCRLKMWIWCIWGYWLTHIQVVLHSTNKCHWIEFNKCLSALKSPWSVKLKTNISLSVWKLDLFWINKRHSYFMAISEDSDRKCYQKNENIYFEKLALSSLIFLMVFTYR